MAFRPETARSEISSAISSAGDRSRPQSNASPFPALPNPPLSQHGYTHLRGITNPTNRSVRTSAAPASNGGSSRPQSPVSQASRTHVPSLTAQGFFKPMSSQRLQAQRLGRPAARTTQSPALTEDKDGASEAGETRSLASSRQGPYTAMPRTHRAAASIVTDYTQSEAPENVDTTSHDYASNPDRDARLFPPVEDEKSLPPRPQRLNLHRNKSSSRDPPQRSPLSFSGFSKHRFEPGHEHLSSTATSPRMGDDVSDEPNKAVAIKSALGKNYEYFEGNTMFWWGGRLQNARDRPINLATGIILVLPSVLFFIFS